MVRKNPVSTVVSFSNNFTHVNFMMDNFTTPSKGLETSRTSLKCSLELILNPNEYFFSTRTNIPSIISIEYTQNRGFCLRVFLPHSPYMMLFQAILFTYSIGFLPIVFFAPLTMHKCFDSMYFPPGFFASLFSSPY